MKDLLFHEVTDFTTIGGAHYERLGISYQLFGRQIGTAPVVMVNHALTGNSDVVSTEKGWWREIVGDDKELIRKGIQLLHLIFQVMDMMVM